MCVDRTDDTCIVILEYTPEACVLPRQENTGIYTQNDGENSNPRQVRSIKNTLRGHALRAASVRRA